MSEPSLPFVAGCNICESVQLWKDVASLNALACAFWALGAIAGSTYARTGEKVRLCKVHDRIVSQVMREAKLVPDPE